MNSTIEADDRTVRALTEFLTVTPDIGRARNEPSCVLVTSESGSEYFVNIVTGKCDCPDHKHRNNECKHIRRARMAMGMTAIPVELTEELDVDDRLGEHTDKELRFVTQDGFEVSGGKTRTVEA